MYSIFWIKDSKTKWQLCYDFTFFFSSLFLTLAHYAHREIPVNWVYAFIKMSNWDATNKFHLINQIRFIRYMLHKWWHWQIVKLMVSWFIFASIQHSWPTTSLWVINEGIWWIKSHRIEIESSVESKWKRWGDVIALIKQRRVIRVCMQASKKKMRMNKQTNEENPNECDKSDWVALNKWPVKTNNYIKCAHE